MPRKPYPYGEPDFNRLYRYLCLHSHFQSLHVWFPWHFAAIGTLSYRFSHEKPMASVYDLSPDHFYILAAVIGMAQGGVQALSRSLFSKMIPAEKVVSILVL